MKTHALLRCLLVNPRPSKHAAFAVQPFNVPSIIYGIGNESRFRFFLSCATFDVPEKSSLIGPLARSVWTPLLNDEEFTLHPVVVEKEPIIHRHSAFRRHRVRSDPPLDVLSNFNNEHCTLRTAICMKRLRTTPFVLGCDQWSDVTRVEICKHEHGHRVHASDVRASQGTFIRRSHTVS